MRFILLVCLAVFLPQAALASLCKDIVVNPGAVVEFSKKYGTWPVLRRESFGSQELVGKTVALLKSSGKILLVHVLSTEKKEMLAVPAENAVSYHSGFSSKPMELKRQDGDTIRAYDKKRHEYRSLSQEERDPEQMIGKIVEYSAGLGRLTAAKFLEMKDEGSNWSPAYVSYFDVTIQPVTPVYTFPEEVIIKHRKIQEIRLQPL